jgi:hypothetical protein
MDLFRFKAQGENMTTKSRLITVTALMVLSILGGILGQSFDVKNGFAVGVLSTYVLLSIVLIVNGKVKLTRKG